MGDATVPHPPSRHKGAKLRFEHRRTNRFPAALRLPTGVLPRKRLAYSAPGGASPLSPLETTPKDREWQRKKKQMVFSLQPDKRHTRRCEDAVIQGTSVSTAGRRLLDFVGSAYRPLLRMGELTACIPAAVRCILTGMFPCWKQRKFWGHSSRQSRDSVLNQQ